MNALKFFFKRFWSTDYQKCIQCPNGWQIYTGTCYYTDSRIVTWQQAQNICSGVGGSLMIINSEYEYNLLLNFYAASGAGRVWVTKSFP